ncbi:MAG: ABC transporter ATP-binding protein [Chloroflexi bacterium]|nr:ABC transporter ATP-binding protein [Chloroflexota bacterium]
MRLQADHVNWSIDGKPILRDVSLAVEPGTITGLIGPNGSGKSTLLRCIYRAQKPDSGTITLDGHDLIRMDSRESARRIAVVLQEYPSDFQFTVGEIVSMGRNPHKGMFDRDTPADRGIIRDALARVGLAGFSHRNFNTLSGGEKQRVIIARTLAQQPNFLVLDEPTNHLDIRYQLETMELVRDLGLTTLAALHDLNIAADYCDFIHVIDGGRIVASGTPAEVLHPDIIADVFGVGSSVGEDTMTGRLRISFYLNGHSSREAAAARSSPNWPTPSRQ